MEVDSTTIHCVLLSQAFGNTSCFIACVTAPREDCSSETIDTFNMSDTVSIAHLPHDEVIYFTAIAVTTRTSVSTLIVRGILKPGNVYIQIAVYMYTQTETALGIPYWVVRYQ